METVVVRGNERGYGPATRTYVVVMEGLTILSVNGKPAVRLTKTSRIVYRCGKYVIKIDEPGHWTGKQNPNEYKAWQRILPEDRKHFATVVAYGEVPTLNTSILIQHFVSGRKPGNGMNDHPMDYVAQDIGSKYGIGDMYSHNYKIRKQGIVIYDLGMARRT